MAAIIKDVVFDFVRGFFDSITGLMFITQLDRDEPTVQPPPRAPVPTILQKRREQKGIPPFRQEDEAPAPRVRAWKRVLHCVGVNVGCVVLLHVILIPIINFIAHILFEESTAVTVSRIMSFAGVLPIFVLSRIVNALWFSDIAGACTRALKLPEPRPIDFRRAAADFVISIVLEMMFLVQSALVMHIPIPVIAPFVSFVHLSLLHSLYSFEYFWMSRSVQLNERIARMERHWPYFVGFGAPLTLAAWASPNFVISGCSFGALFPLFIISSYKTEGQRRGHLPRAETIPALNIFFPSQVVTNRISYIVSERLTKH